MVRPRSYLAELRPEAALVRMQEIETCCAPGAARSTEMTVSMSSAGLHCCASRILGDPGSISGQKRCVDAAPIMPESK